MDECECCGEATTSLDECGECGRLICGNCNYPDEAGNPLCDFCNPPKAGADDNE